MKKVLSICLIFLISFSVVFATGNSEIAEETKDGMSVLVYVTGVVAGSPTYQMMVEGAEEFQKERENVTLKVYEAGFNQAEWESQLTDLVATGQYDVVVASNPSLPEICQNVAAKFKNQKFIITDAYKEGNSQITTYLYNQYEQGLLLGYLAGLVTTGDMKYANPEKKIGFVAAQNYPLLESHIIPGFLDGARMVDPDITLDERIVGNWYDAGKAAELSKSMTDNGVDVFMVIAGGATQGVITTAEEQGAYIVLPDTDEYKNSDNIVGCTQMYQKRMVHEALCSAYDGTIEYGKATIVGIKEGYIDFVDDNPLYAKANSETVRAEFDSFLEKIRAGDIDYTTPEL